MGATDEEEGAGLCGVDFAVVKLLEDELNEWGGLACGELFFFTSQSEARRSQCLGASSAFATLRPPQPLDTERITEGKVSVSF